MVYYARWRSFFSMWPVILLVLLAAQNSWAALGCNDCHGQKSPADIRPLDLTYRNVTTGGFPGNHSTHLPNGVTPGQCAVCHPGSDKYLSNHRDGRIKLSANLNNSPQTARYKNQTSSFAQTANTIFGTCSNVNCHFENTTPVWSSSPLAVPQGCDTCHSAPPADGSHPAISGRGKKHGQYLGIGISSCNKCHTDHSSSNAPFAHATSVGKRALNVQFSISPNSSGTYTGDLTYPNYLPSRNPARNGSCNGIYCHSNALGQPPNRPLTWSDSRQSKCYSCHNGRTADNTQENCDELGGTWATVSNPEPNKPGIAVCRPYLNMTSNGHARLVGPQWIRKYPCSYCHADTVDASGTIINLTKHVDKNIDVVISSQWAIVGRPAPSYNSTTKVCDNVYCHSDGTTDPGPIKLFPWTAKKTECNTCHGHDRDSCENCHPGRTGWPDGEEWKSAMPMFPNQGPGASRANSHTRHLQTNFACDKCHYATIKNGTCTATDCHGAGIPPQGKMGEVAHIDAAYHVNKSKDVVFKNGGSYNPVTKTCSNTSCHTGFSDPVWGASVTSTVVCLNCHGAVGADVDDFASFNGIQAKINVTEWSTTGHGRPTSAGPYPVSGNPAANFPANPCWYCHDPNILHKDVTNPFRLRLHSQFSQRFEKECVYCHMEGKDAECMGCHNATESLAPQLSSIYPPKYSRDHRGFAGGTTSCVATCHSTNATRHKTSTDLWTAAQKADIRNQYVMMGVCLKCHDDDSGGRCTSCHSTNPSKYSLGFNPLLPGTGFIKPQKARASSVHFGHKHYAGYQQTGIWKGGKFCWDCHDPHGDANIYMIQTQVATTTDGTFGIPQTRAQVSFTKKQSGLDYARINAPYNGICNVCHTAGSQHYRVDGGDGHNSSRVCTGCHEHRFTDSHADKQSCNTCHQNKPVPRHSAFGLPRDCTKCHGGIIGKRTDVMGQFRSNSHHVQGAEVTNKQCYACHWEATSLGLIDVRYHKGYNYLNYSSVKNAPVELVIWGPGTRPTSYKRYSTAVQFLATNMGTASERGEIAKITLVCVGCHSDQNNETQPFRNTTSQCNNDFRTPTEYSWDRTSVASRYQQKGTTTWGKYDSTVYGTSKKDTVVKAFSAHGNATANQGGWSATSGYDGAIPLTRGGSGARNVECFDCHNSHGSKVAGVTSSYVTFNGSNNGANLKETQAGKGGYGVTYMAQANATGVNKYAAGAGQCFDCHETAMAGTTPWGYSGSFGASAPILGYKDTSRFGQGVKGSTARYSYRDSRKTIVGGHLQASSFLKYSASRKINGLCTPCHDPHGVSQSLGANQAYGVPLLKGTWLTSPYPEDRPAPAPVGSAVNVDESGTPRSWGHYYTPPSPTQPYANYNVDRTTLGGATRISEEENQFAGLCLGCHRKENLNSNRGSQFKTTERIHEAVKGWGNNREHSYSCSKCHQPHNSGLPRLMQTNCLNFNHRGERASGGQAWSADSESSAAHGNGFQHRGYPIASVLGNSDTAEATGSCHGAAVNNPGTWPTKNLWNNLTPW